MKPLGKMRPEQYNRLEEVRSFKGIGANLKVGQKEGDDLRKYVF